MFKPFSLNLDGTLLTVSRPQVMGIVNVTPDSFYAPSRMDGVTASVLEKRIAEMVADGADMIDVGGCSTRPGSPQIDAAEEWRRVKAGVGAVRQVAPHVPVSIDTYRSEIVEKAVGEFGALIVNDISGGNLDPLMWEAVARLRVPYVLMHMRGTPETMQKMTDYDNVTADLTADLSRKLRQLRLMGVADVIVDPGFGFGKTVSQNYTLMRDLEVIGRALEAPLLVGISRKSMITRPLGITPDEALQATVALNTLALIQGASFIRVHDVKAAADALKMYLFTSTSSLTL